MPGVKMGSPGPGGTMTYQEDSQPDPIWDVILVVFIKHKRLGVQGLNVHKLKIVIIVGSVATKFQNLDGDQKAELSPDFVVSSLLPLCS